MRKIWIRGLCTALILWSVTGSVWAMPKSLIPGGCTVGVKLCTKGLMVTGFEAGSAARAAGLKKGDLILEVDGQQVHTTAALRSCLEEEQVILTVLRGGREAEFCVKPRENRLGAYVRDSVAGIGTVTYYDPDTGDFGALGHGVSDADTRQLLPMEAGVVVSSQVSQVQKGLNGSPGELKGCFDVNDILGTVTINSDQGLFGRMTAPIPGTPVPVGDAETVRTGPAQILSNVEGTVVERYDVEILKLFPHADDTGRNLLLQVTDEALLQTTGGIVQGMSGSPIIQNGKLVGAVTHVLVNDPTRGYGIFIENMLDAAE